MRLNFSRRMAAHLGDFAKKNVKCKSITLSVPLFLVCAFQKYESCTLLLGLIARQQFESTDPGAVWINCNFRRKKWHNSLKQAPSGHHLVQNLLKFAPAWTEHISHLAFPASCDVSSTATWKNLFTLLTSKKISQLPSFRVASCISSRHALGRICWCSELLNFSTSMLRLFGTKIQSDDTVAHS